jgi:aminoglycoside phosphotransferase (APT) family kinase protein
MKLARRETTIPVPEVYIDTATGHPLVVMNLIEGDCLVDVWDGMSGEQKQHIIEQLRDHFSQLRKMEGSFIGSVDGAAREGQLFRDDLGAYGLYKDEAIFNEGIVKALKEMLSGGWVDTVCNMATTMKGHKIVVTHGDLSPRNIMVQGSKVVAVSD